jgi:hypothetical protein
MVVSRRGEDFVRFRRFVDDVTQRVVQSQPWSIGSSNTLAWTTCVSDKLHTVY